MSKRDYDTFETKLVNDYHFEYLTRIRWGAQLVLHTCQTWGCKKIPPSGTSWSSWCRQPEAWRRWCIRCQVAERRVSTWGTDHFRINGRFWRQRRQFGLCLSKGIYPTFLRFDIWIHLKPSRFRLKYDPNAKNTI